MRIGGPSDLRFSSISNRYLGVCSDLETGRNLDCCILGSALIELFKSISVLGKWPYNRLLGQVIAAESLVITLSIGLRIAERFIPCE
jgi:hypothetical protein